WKRRLIDLASPAPGARALDLATGTGDIAFALAERGARVVGLDVTLRMLELAQIKSTRAVPSGGRSSPESLALHLVQADMVALPFSCASFDIVTTGYGLRNVPDLNAAIDEIGRVLAPGGQLLSLDFNRPLNPIVRSAYLAYLTAVGAALGW